MKDLKPVAALFYIKIQEPWNYILLYENQVLLPRLFLSVAITLAEQHSSANQSMCIDYNSA